MIRKKVLGVGVHSATLLVEDSEMEGVERVLRRINVSDWNQRDIQSAFSMYKTISQARLTNFVPLHSVQLQNSFLNIVTSFCPGGDVALYLEEDMVGRAVPEGLAIRWILAVAQCVMDLHQQTHLCFYGLGLDRMYIETKAPAGIMVGVPLTAVSYFHWLEEKRRDHVDVEAEYPPEVVHEALYHPTLSDVWYLGFLLKKLLSTNASFTSSSAEAQQLVSHMMHSELNRRLPMPDAVEALTSLARKRPTEPAQTVLPNFGARRFDGPDEEEAPSAAIHSDTGSSRSARLGVPQRQPYENPKLAATFPHRSAARSGGAHPAVAAAAIKTRGPRRDSWHRKALEQFHELERMHASPPQSRHPSPANGARSAAVPPVRSGGGVPPQRLSPGSTPGKKNAKSVPNRRPKPQSAAKAAREDDVEDQLVLHNLLREAWGSDNPYSPTADRRLREELDQRRRKQEVHHARADGGAAPPQHRDPRHLPDEVEARHTDIRKYIKEWQKQSDDALMSNQHVEVLGGDGVVIVSPKPCPPASGRGGGGEQIQADSHNRGVPVEVFVPQIRSTSAAGERYATPTARGGRIPTPTRNPTPTTAQARGAAGNMSPRAPASTSTIAPRTQIPTPTRARSSDRGRYATPVPLQPPQPMTDRSKQRPMLQASPGPESRSGGAPRRFPSPMGGATSTSVGGTGGEDPRWASPRSAQVKARPAASSSVAALHWSIDGTRASLRRYIGNSSEYGEAMTAVAVLAQRSERDRLSPRFTSAFAERLKEVVGEERARAVVPLCSQLVALEALKITFTAEA